MARYPKKSSPKLTKELINQIASVIKGGNYIETAIAYCGISKDTFYRWLKLARSEDGTSLHRELSDAVAYAFAEASVRDLEVIDRHIMGTDDEYFMIHDENLNQMVPYLDKLGKPVVRKYGIKPDPSLAQWRLSKRRPKDWGNGVREEEEIKPELTEKELARKEKEDEANLKRYLEILEATGGL